MLCSQLWDSNVKFTHQVAINSIIIARYLNCPELRHYNGRLCFIKYNLQGKTTYKYFAGMVCVAGWESVLNQVFAMRESKVLHILDSNWRASRASIIILK